MALQVWLPLINNTNNQGTSSVSGSLTHSSITYETGKLGRAIRIANYATSTATYSGIVNKTIWSVCCWIKISSSDTFTNYQDFFTLGCDNGGTSAGGFRIEHTNVAGGVQLVTPKSTSYGSNTNSWWTFTSHANMCKDQWGHFVIVNDGTNYKTYFNGVLSNTTAISSFTPNTSKLTGTLILGMSGTYCWMNDFRVYDHALSDKEVKNVYSTLALHWACNNNGSGASNLLPNYGSYFSESAAYTWTSNAKDGYKWLPGSHFIVEPSTTYTFSVYSDGNLANGHNTGGTSPSSKAFTMWMYLCNSNTTKDYVNGQYDQAICFCSTNYNYQHIGNRHIWQYTTTSTQTHMSIRVNNYSDGTNNLTIKYWKLKVEKGNIATPWCPNVSDSLYASRGYNSTTEWDTSGFNRHGTKIGNITYDGNSVRYSCCSYFSDGYSNYITAPIQLGTDFCTMSIWVRSKTGIKGKGDYHIPFCIDASKYEFSIDSNGKFRQGFYINGSRVVNTTPNPDIISDMKWHMITATYDGTNVKRYVDGVLVQTQAATGPLTGGSLTVYVGGRYGSSIDYGSKEIFLSDARIYATALSADNIKELYQTSASIINNGTLLAYEFIED